MIKNASFVGFFGTDDKGVLRALMVVRKDGKLGFPGGKNEEGETDIQTIIRECSEEIGLNVSFWNMDHICSHAVHETLQSNFYAVHISMDALYKMAESSYKHILSTGCSELSGVCTPEISQIIKNTPVIGAPTVHEEILCYLDTVLDIPLLGTI